MARERLASRLELAHYKTSWLIKKRAGSLYNESSSSRAINERVERVSEFRVFRPALTIYTFYIVSVPLLHPF
jgi:hypothetical protein